MGYDFSLKRAVVEVDRDADRRWSFATDKMKLAEDKGETFSDSAPLEDFKKAKKPLEYRPGGGGAESFRTCFIPITSLGKFLSMFVLTRNVIPYNSPLKLPEREKKKVSKNP